jgi:hypothetical protein
MKLGKRYIWLVLLRMIRILTLCVIVYPSQGLEIVVWLGFSEREDQRARGSA